MSTTTTILLEQLIGVRLARQVIAEGVYDLVQVVFAYPSKQFSIVKQS